MADDLTLLRRIAKSRDVAAFDDLYRSYYRRLVSFVLRVTGRPDLVEEVVNDTMMAVWRGADGFAERAKVSTWIFGIAYRQGRQAKTRAASRPETVDVDDVELVEGTTPEDHAQQAGQRRQLLHAMARLSSAQRTVVELTYFQGYRYHEIAEVMGCPVDTVKTRMFHARAKLRSLLEADRNTTQQVSGDRYGLQE